MLTGKVWDIQLHMNTVNQSINLYSPMLYKLTQKRNVAGCQNRQ